MRRKGHAHYFSVRPYPVRRLEGNDGKFQCLHLATRAPEQLGKGYHRFCQWGRKKRVNDRTRPPHLS